MKVVDISETSLRFYKSIKQLLQNDRHDKVHRRAGNRPGSGVQLHHLLPKRIGLETISRTGGTTKASL